MRTAAAFRQILADLDCIDADQSVLQQVRDIVRKVGADHGVALIDKTERVHFARRLLDLKVSRPTIRERLKARYDIGKSEAYRVIDEALQLSQKPPEIGTAGAENETCEIEERKAE